MLLLYKLYVLLTTFKCIDELREILLWHIRSLPHPKKRQTCKGPKGLKSLLFSLANGAPPPCLALPLSLVHSHHPGDLAPNTAHLRLRACPLQIPQLWMHPHLPLLPPTSVYIVLTLPSNFSLQLAWSGRPCFTAPHKIIQCSFFPHPGFFSSIHVYAQVTCYTLLCFVCIFQVSASSPKLGTLCHCPIYSALKDVWGSTC